MNRVRSLLNMRCLLLGYSFESRRNSSALGPRLSYDHCSINKRTLSLGKTKYDKRKEDWLVQKFGLRQLESLDAIQAEPPFLLITQEDNLVPRVLSYSAPVARKKGRWERGCQEDRRRLCSAHQLVAYMTDAKKEEEGKKSAKRKRGRDPFPSLPIFLLFFPFRSPQRKLNILGNYSHFSHT